METTEKVPLEGFTNKTNGAAVMLVQPYLLILWASEDGGEKVRRES